MKPILRLCILSLIISSLIAISGLRTSAQTPACTGVTFPASVSTDVEFNAALVCYNSLTAPGTYTINFTADFTMALTSGVSNGTSDTKLVINGNGHTIDGANSSQLLIIGSFSNFTTVEINNLTLQNGRVSEVSDGGAISMRPGSRVTIRNSTFSGNSAQSWGGAIYNNGGTLHIVNSTFSNNRATFGGAIFSSLGQAIISNSTFSGNAATGSGGAIEIDGGMTISNSIFANSTAGGDCHMSNRGTLTSLGTNLIEDGSCNAAANGQLTGDPMLGPLADNGGSTQTFVLQTGSPAINAGDNTYLSESAFSPAIDLDGDGLATGSLTSDQTGASRINGTSVDLGALEATGCAAGFPIDVTTESELNAAIGCYNTQTAAGIYTVNINANITLSATTTLINNATAGVQLALNGAGNILNGGGNRIFTLGQFTHMSIDSLTLNGGSGQDGGAIFSDGTLIVRNSTFNGNGAKDGSAVYNRGGGRLTLSNSTFASNTGSTIFNLPGGQVTIISSTLSNNSSARGAIENRGTLTLANSIVANSTGAGDCSSTTAVTFLGVNLIEDGTCGASSTAGQLTGDPALGALADNGGPTQTFALLAGSIAINAGNNSFLSEAGFTPPIDFNGDGDTADALTTDQRGAGFVRVLDSTVDLGAFESDPCLSFSFPASVATEAELNTAIRCYNAVTVEGTYTVNITANITLSADTTPINNATAGVQLAINGGNTTLNGASSYQLFDIAQNTSVSISNLTLRSGSATNGGAISNRGTLVVRNSYFRDNVATNRGGAIDHDQGTLSVIGSTFENNSATSAGGGIYFETGGAVSNSTFFNNRAADGGAINHEASILTLANNTLYNNTGTTSGGSVLSEGTLRLTNNILANSPAGADCVSLGTVQRLSPNLIEDGSCGASGDSTQLTGVPGVQPVGNYGGPTLTFALQTGSAAINAGDNSFLSEAAFTPAVDFNGDGDTTDTLTTDQRGIGFSRTVATTVDLGALEVIGCAATGLPSSVTISTEAELNESIGCYNAVTVAGTYTFNITANIALTANTTQINNNTADVRLAINGAGNTVDGASSHRIFSINRGTVDINSITLSNGFATDGGAIRNLAGTLTLRNSTLRDNAASGGGGALSTSLDAIVMNTTFSGNTGGTIGGAAIVNNGGLTVISSTFSGNTNPSGGATIISGPTPVFVNTIVANTTSGADCSGIVNFLGTNLIEDGSCGASSAAGQLTGDPRLGPLANNGGPTQTFALLPGSIAINAGDNTFRSESAFTPPVDFNGDGDTADTLTTDQRGTGFSRTVATTVDLGALEVSGCVATGLASSVTITTEAELNESISCYNAVTVAGTYTFNIAASITLTGTNRINNRTSGTNLVINGNGYTIDGANSHRILRIEFTDVEIKDITLQNGSVVDGGAIFNTDGASVTVRNSTFKDNFSYDWGGAIVNLDGSLVVINSTFTRNTARTGGAIENFGQLTVRGSSFSGNQADVGGAINTTGSSTTLIIDSSFSANDALVPNGLYSWGGAISNFGTMAVVNSTFAGNVANTTGGAIDNRSDAVLSLLNNSFSANSATTGGALHNTASVTLWNNILANSASGGDCINTGTLTFGAPNLIEDGSCGASSTAGQLTGDPALGPLANNGGPTQTFALQMGSIALNAGDNTYLSESAFTPPIDFDGDGDTNDTLLTDQRGAGFPRILTTTVDLGAVEGLVATRGDCNADGLVDAGDIAALNIELSSSGSFDPIGCDVDASGVIDSADLTCARARAFNPTASCNS